MVRQIGIVMDPIDAMLPYKDTTFAMMLAAEARGWVVHVIDQKDLFLAGGKVHSRSRQVRVKDDPANWFDAEEAVDAPLTELDIVLMRKDPPFDMDYIYTTYLLERATLDGVLVSNRPSSLRDVNEKLFTAWYSEFCPPTLVSARRARLKAFVDEHRDVVIKPLDGMGGTGIFRLTPNDPNLNMILEQSTDSDRLQIMAQRFVPEIVEGDKRVLVIHGEAVPFALARIPAQGETRGNLAAGGRGVPVAIGDAERRIVDAIAPALVERGLDFVGLDVIGHYLTEVNVTSPTCAREIDAHIATLADGSDATDEADRVDPWRQGLCVRYLDGLEQRLS